MGHVEEWIKFERDEWIFIIALLLQKILKKLVRKVMSRKVHNVFFYPYQDHNRSVYIVQSCTCITNHSVVYTSNNIKSYLDDHLFTHNSFIFNRKVRK